VQPFLGVSVVVAVFLRCFSIIIATFIVEIQHSVVRLKCQLQNILSWLRRALEVHANQLAACDANAGREDTFLAGESFAVVVQRVPDCDNLASGAFR
jgi:hypothetical protein